MPATPRRGHIAHNTHIGRPIWHNRFLRWLVAGYVAVFVLSAVAPHDRGDWLLENTLVFALLAGLAACHSRFAFSNFSSLLLVMFLALHALGAHYTYSLTPLGFWMQELLDLPRNPYDRLVHFAFGLLLTYPAREVCRRILHLHGAWAYIVPLLGVLALSAGYEIIESWTARVVDPALGTAFLGTQGDEWDAQKDMALALVGSVIALGLTGFCRMAGGREPWSWLQDA